MRSHKCYVWSQLPCWQWQLLMARSTVTLQYWGTTAVPAGSTLWAEGQTMLSNVVIAHLWLVVDGQDDLCDTCCFEGLSAEQQGS
jgi:hypothetical protein